MEVWLLPPESTQVFLILLAFSNPNPQRRSFLEFELKWAKIEGDTDQNEYFLLASVRERKL